MFQDLLENKITKPVDFLTSPFKILRCGLLGPHNFKIVRFFVTGELRLQVTVEMESISLSCGISYLFPKCSSKIFPDFLCFVSGITENFILANGLSLLWCKALCVPRGSKITSSVSWWAGFFPHAAFLAILWPLKEVAGFFSICWLFFTVPFTLS